jgi:hypothetical protein
VARGQTSAALVMVQLIVRFVIGGALVSLFAVLGDLFTSKSFAGLFAAAPSVALATLILAVHMKGLAYCALEARSMVVGAIAFLGYTTAVGWSLHRCGGSPRARAVVCMVAWFAIAACGWTLWLRMS